MKKESKRSKEKKKEERTKKHKRPNSLYLHNFLSLVFSLFWRDCDLVEEKTNRVCLDTTYFVEIKNLLLKVL